MKRTPRNDSGFTLLELSISIMVMFVVLSAMLTVVTVSSRNTQEATQQIDSSFDRQTLSAYFASDMQSVRCAPTFDGTTLHMVMSNGGVVEYVHTGNELVRKTLVSDVIARDVESVTYSAGTLTVAFKNGKSAPVYGKGRMSNASAAC